VGSPFRSVADQLFVDRAVALQVPYARPDVKLASCTISTAQEAGWTWDIGLRQRRGLGYVYSSRHSDADRAEQVLRAHIGPTAEGLTARHLRFEVGYRPVQWIGNCVAVGLSGGFLEPLESSGIGLIETACYLIAHLFPGDGVMPPVARTFNELMAARYARVVDFLKLHYALTQRRDTAFWIENADPATRSDALTDKLALWRSRPPHRLDFIADLEMYATASWQYVLYGMQYPTRLDDPARWPDMAAARREFATLRQVGARAVLDLPDHRALLDQINDATAGLARAG
jgi:tryptophan halogenase